MILTKNCSRCKRELPQNSFRKQRGTKDGLQYECKSCTSLRAKERYLDKQEEIIAKNLEWQVNNKEKHAAAAKRHYDSPTGKIGRSLNKRLDELLGKQRESFFHLIGLTPSVLLVHLNGGLPEGMKLDEYGDKWVVAFAKPVNQTDLEQEFTQRILLNWKNLVAKAKEDENSLDLEILSVS